jgi:hypothetical protein
VLSCGGVSVLLACMHSLGAVVQVRAVVGLHAVPVLLWGCLLCECAPPWLQANAWVFVGVCCASATPPWLQAEVCSLSLH